MSDYEIPEYKNRRDWMLREPLKPITVKYTEMTMKKRLHLRDVQTRLLKEGKITKEEYNDLIKEYPLPSDEDSID